MACFWLALAALALALLGPLVRWALRAAAARRVEPRNVCGCGYPLRQLALPRCPECGRVIGFEASQQDLGLSDEELQRIAQRRRDRDAGGR